MFKPDGNITCAEVYVELSERALLKTDIDKDITPKLIVVDEYSDVK